MAAGAILYTKFGLVVKSVGTEIDRLEIQVEAEAQKANRQLETMIGKLERVADSLMKVNSGGLAGMANGIQRFVQAAGGLSNVKTADFTRLVKNIDRISALNVQQMYGTSSAITTVAKAINSLDGVSDKSVQIADMAKNISKLGGVNVERAITNLPQLAAALNDFMRSMHDAPVVSRDVIQMTKALADLASQGGRAGTAANAVSRSLNNQANSANRAARSTLRLSSIIGGLYQKYFWVRNISSKVLDSVEDSMDYVETYNYFNVTMNKIGTEFAAMYERFGYESAEAYAESFEDRLSGLVQKMTGYRLGESGELVMTDSLGLALDPEQMMKFQAKVSAVTNSVGLIGEASASTSKALSMLSADLSSLTNTDLESVMNSLSSGLIGQSRALYKYGIDITNNTLQQYALAYGIEKTVQEMTQAEKMQLRMLAIFDQSKVAWGDQANTIDSVANQYRIMEQQWQNLSRTLGNLFLPIVQDALPMVNGLIIAMNRLFTSLGFSLWGDSWLEDLQDGISGGIGEDFEGIEDGADGASDAVKSLKKNLQGFDELNVISVGSEFSTGGVGDFIDLTDQIGSSLEDYESVWDKAFEDMENKAEEFADKIEPKLQGVVDVIDALTPALAGAAGAFATYSIATKVGAIGTAFSKLATVATSPTGAIALIVGGIVAIAAEAEKTKRAIEEQQLKNIFNVFSENGTRDLDAVRKSLDDITTSFSGMAEEVSGKYQGITQNISSIANSRNATNIAKQGIDNIASAVGLAATTVAEKSTEIKQSFQGLLDGTKTIFEEQYDVIVEGLAGPIGDTLTALGVDNSEIISLLSKTRSGLLQTLEDVEKQKAELDKKFSKGEISDSEYMKQLVALSDTIADFTIRESTVDEAKKALDSLVGAFDMGAIISTQGAMDISALQGFLNELSQSYVDSTKVITDSADGLKAALEDYYFYAGNIVDPMSKEGMEGLKEIEKAIDGVGTHVESEKDKIAGYYKDIFEGLPEQALNQFPQIVAGAIKDYDSMGAWKKAKYESLGGTQKSYIENAVKEYQEEVNKVMSTIFDEMKEVGITPQDYSFVDDVFADFWTKVDENYSKGLFGNDKMVDIFGTGAYETLFNDILKNYDDELNSELQKAGEVFSRTSEENGKNITAGFDLGVKNGTGASVSTITGFAGATTRALKNFLQINSPSKLTESYGQYFVEGFNIGIEENTSAVLLALENFAQSIQTKLDSMTFELPSFEAMAFPYGRAEIVEPFKVPSYSDMIPAHARMIPEQSTPSGYSFSSGNSEWILEQILAAVRSREIDLTLNLDGEPIYKKVIKLEKERDGTGQSSIKKIVLSGK